MRAANGLPAGRRVGLLGGSFNPAHEGHRHISLLALKHLDLDAVWWLVSPGNPLKDARENAPLADRLVRARAVAGHAAIAATDIETRLGTRFTVDTLAALKTCFPDTRFVWLMGADNLLQMDRWKRWQEIFRLVPVAIFDRAPYASRALAGKAARRFARHQLLWPHARRLADHEPPAWSFFHARLHHGSATAIRARRVADAPADQPRREI